jgi:hypothetical protein
MNDSLGFTITLIGYLAGAWVAFKIYDWRTKGQTGKRDGLLFVLLLVFAGGGGTLLVFLLKSMMGLR